MVLLHLAELGTSKSCGVQVLVGLPVIPCQNLKGPSWARPVLVGHGHLNPSRQPVVAHCRVADFCWLPRALVHPWMCVQCPLAPYCSEIQLRKCSEILRLQATPL